MKITTMFISMTLVCWCQPKQLPLISAKPAEAPIRQTFTVTESEHLVGCVIAETDFTARVVRVDCSAAAPWTSKDKTVRRFCVVKPGERLVVAYVESQSRILRRCDVEVPRA